VFPSGKQSVLKVPNCVSDRCSIADCLLMLWLQPLVLPLLRLLLTADASIAGADGTGAATVAAKMLQAG